MKWEKYHDHSTRHYDALRKACHAPRGWEPWERWEDSMVRSLVERGKRTVKKLANKLQRTENAILCRIEKRYGKDKRGEFEPPLRTWGGPPHTLIPVDPTLPLRYTLLADLENRVLNAMFYGTSHPHIYREPTVTKESRWDILRRVETDIRVALHTFQGRAIDPERWAYRVTEAEYNAIWAVLDENSRRWGCMPQFMPRKGLTVAGVRLEVREDFPVKQEIKDYGSSG